MGEGAISCIERYLSRLPPPEGGIVENNMSCPKHPKGYHDFVLRMKGFVCRRCGAVQTNIWSILNLHLTYTPPPTRKEE